MGQQEPWICVGDIYHPARKAPDAFRHGTVFPVEEVRAWTRTDAAKRAKKDGLTDAEDVAAVQDEAEAEFERNLADLIEIGSLKRPEDVLPPSDLAAQLRTKEVELEALRAQLAAAGVPPSLPDGPLAKQVVVTSVTSNGPLKSAASKSATAQE